MAGALLQATALQAQTGPCQACAGDQCDFLRADTQPDGAALVVLRHVLADTWTASPRVGAWPVNPGRAKVVAIILPVGSRRPPARFTGWPAGWTAPSAKACLHSRGPGAPTPWGPCGGDCILLTSADLAAGQGPSPAAAHTRCAAPLLLAQAAQALSGCVQPWLILTASTCYIW